jgi:hypothetical protein
MQPLDGQFFQNLLNEGYTNDFRNLAVVAAHGIDDKTSEDMISAYFQLPVNPAPLSIRVIDLDPTSYDPDTECFEFAIPATKTNADITFSVVKWTDPQQGTRVSIDALLGLIRWFNIDTLNISKASDAQGDTIVYSAMCRGKLVINMDLTRDRP